MEHFHVHDLIIAHNKYIKLVPLEPEKTPKRSQMPSVKVTGWRPSRNDTVTGFMRAGECSCCLWEHSQQSLIETAFLGSRNNLKRVDAMWKGTLTVLDVFLKNHELSYFNGWEGENHGDGNEQVLVFGSPSQK